MKHRDVIDIRGYQGMREGEEQRRSTRARLGQKDASNLIGGLGREFGSQLENVRWCFLGVEVSKAQG